jgi:hypothetical protein
MSCYTTEFALMKAHQLQSIYHTSDEDSLSPFFTEQSYFLNRMSELWGEEIWEEVDLEGYQEQNPQEIEETFVNVNFLPFLPIMS